jgi:hypothetical protein
MDEKIRKASEAETSPRFGGNPGEPIPQVDPEDLKALWRLQRDVEARHPGQQIAIGCNELAQHYCKPGADIQAVGYRVSFLWLMSRIVPEQFAAFTKDGQPIDAAFRAAAKVPAEWMEVGVARQRPPFDMNEFTRLCAEEREEVQSMPDIYKALIIGATPFIPIFRIACCG